MIIVKLQLLSYISSFSFMKTMDDIETILNIEECSGKCKHVRAVD